MEWYSENYSKFASPRPLPKRDFRRLRSTRLSICTVCSFSFIWRVRPGTWATKVTKHAPSYRPNGCFSSSKCTEYGGYLVDETSELPRTAFLRILVNRSMVSRAVYLFAARRSSVRAGGARRGRRARVPPPPGPSPGRSLAAGTKHVGEGSQGALDDYRKKLQLSSATLQPNYYALQPYISTRVDGIEAYAPHLQST